MRYGFLFLLFVSASVFAQDASLCGSVYNEAGEPLPFVSLNVLGPRKNLSASADKEGRFCLQGLQRGDSVVFLSAGFQKAVYVVERDTSLRFELSFSPFDLRPAAEAVAVHATPTPRAWRVRVLGPDSQGREEGDKMASSNIYMKVEVSPLCRASRSELERRLAAGLVWGSKKYEDDLSFTFLLDDQNRIRDIGLLMDFDTTLSTAIFQNLKGLDSFSGVEVNGKKLTTQFRMKLHVEATRKKVKLQLVR